ncbi:Uncharacterised protein [Candidatus Tiddalikarchaeum anstoanum]|nr:Uncharacterised protein [Candidatus Tiddalikarchaeum anstoanum]
MSLNIIFSFISELNVIKYTISKTDRYIKLGYKYSLPKDVAEFSSITDISKSLKNEYNEAEYENVKKSLESDYSKIEHKFIESLTKVFGDKIPRDFDVVLTKYGVVGAFNPPNKVTINFTNTCHSPINILVHEILHLIIEPFVIMYNINQMRKERTVDLLLNSGEFNMLGFNSWQSNYNGAEKVVDELFKNDFFASPEQFFKKLSKIK